MTLTFLVLSQLFQKIHSGIPSRDFPSFLKLGPGPRVATVREKVWEMKFFPGQGQVREF